MNADQQNPPPNSHDTLQIALETTGLSGSLAVLQGEKVLRECKLDAGRRTAATLAPALDQTLQWCRNLEFTPQMVAVASGPGSFTGLRIGVTTAKTLAYATHWRLVSVNSLAAIAASCFAAHSEIEQLLIGINAYRGQVFTATFGRTELLIPLAALRGQSESSESTPFPSPWQRDWDQINVVDAATWSKILSAARPGDFVSGDEKVFRDRSDLHFVQRENADAIGVGLLGIRAAALNQFSDPLGLLPQYLRASAAEEKIAGRGE